MVLFLGWSNFPGWSEDEFQQQFGPTSSAQWSSCRHIPVRAVVSPSTVHTVVNCLPLGGAVVCPRGAGQGGDAAYRTVMTLGTLISLDALAGWRTDGTIPAEVTWTGKIKLFCYLQPLKYSKVSFVKRHHTKMLVKWPRRSVLAKIVSDNFEMLIKKIIIFFFVFVFYL